MANIKFETLKDEYTHLINTMKIKSSWAPAVASVAAKIRKNRKHYEEISKLCGGDIPWQFIGVIHNLECGLSFSKHLHNGDSLKARTKRVPQQRPEKGSPPFTFEESAVDALKIKGYDKITDWSFERMAYELERYNGWGYRQYHSHVLSPYLWSGSNHYTKGKYITDGKWSETTVSKQIGVIPLLTLLDVAKLKKKSTKWNFFNRLEKLVGITTITAVVGLWEKMVKLLQTPEGIAIVGLTVVLAVTIAYFKYKQNQDVLEGRYVPSGIVEDDNVVG